MAWNEPGNGGQKDPWGKKSNAGDGPPDLDEVVRNLQQKISGLFGGGQGGSGSAQGDDSGGGRSISIIAAILILVWMLSGIYIIEPAERGVVTRFGAFTKVAMPGPHWHIPFPFERVEVVDVSQIRTVEIGYRSAGARPETSVQSEALMLTNDENIVDLKVAGQYRIEDARNYLFNVRNADVVLRQMMESAVREVVGQSDMDFVLTEGRSEVARRTEELLQTMLDAHDTGLMVTSVSMQDVQPPEQVQAAFADAVRAREDEVRSRNQAEAYANEILPRARGEAFRVEQEAQAYRSQVIARAEGESSRFLQVMKEYNRAPMIMTERLYLEAMESIYARTPKVLVDVSSESNNVLYLPLDKMRGSASGVGALDLDNLSAFSNNAGSAGSPSAASDARNRGGR